MNVSADQAPFDRPYTCRLQNSVTENFLTLGACSYIGGLDCHFPMDDNKSHNILIGRFSSLAQKIIFMIGWNHPYKTVSGYPFHVDRVVKKVFGAINPAIKPTSVTVPNRYQILVGNDVWIGESVRVMGGVKIGNGAVIGAGAVVAKDIPPYAIAVGNPARVVKYRFDEATIKRLLAVKWWNWSLEKIADNLPLMTDVEKFLETHYSPALDEFPEDDITRQINTITTRRGGGYHLIADFRALQPLWPKVVRDFSESKRKDALLIIWLGKDTTPEDSRALTAAINLCGDAGKRIATVFAHGSQIFSPAAFRKGTHFITTHDMTTLEALDYLWDTDVKVVSALDDGIFER